MKPTQTRMSSGRVSNSYYTTVPLFKIIQRRDNKHKLIYILMHCINRSSILWHEQKLLDLCYIRIISFCLCKQVGRRLMMCLVYIFKENINFNNKCNKKHLIFKRNTEMDNAAMGHVVLPVKSNLQFI